MEARSMYPKPLLRRGISLGVKSSIVASLLFWGVAIIVGLLSKGTDSPNLEANPYVVTAIFVLATMVVSLLPGIIGGATNAYVLYRLSSRNKLTRATSVASGLLIGFSAGFATVLGVSLISGNIGYIFAEVVQVALLAACVAALVGGWHGWVIGRWLLKAP
jgi:hypothetical protein